MKKYVKVKYQLGKTKGIILINESIVDEAEIKRLCIEDYLEKWSKKVKIIKEENKYEYDSEK